MLLSAVVTPWTSLTDIYYPGIYLHAQQADGSSHEVVSAIASSEISTHGMSLTQLYVSFSLYGSGSPGRDLC